MIAHLVDEQRLTGGVTAQVSYTVAKNLSDLTNADNAYNRKQERSYAYSPPCKGGVARRAGVVSSAAPFAGLTLSHTFKSSFPVLSPNLSSSTPTFSNSVRYRFVIGVSCGYRI